MSIYRIGCPVACPNLRPSATKSSSLAVLLTSPSRVKIRWIARYGFRFAAHGAGGNEFDQTQIRFRGRGRQWCRCLQCCRLF